ncbi:hypothetical protein CMI37_12195 [Candidatus Pacearchaeota archaeon]|nr:hypothetical protein [Candidatus Pacearchaeota archaeon]|tara:strand:+ start:15169 stop:16236 length:1068 start_codon:yes stop_codon:yes gene_type:complete
MTSNNTQDLIFKAKFEDDASEDIQNLDKDVEGLDSSMGGLSMSAVTAGLAMFGVGVGVQQVISGSVEAHKRIVATKALISLLPESARSALNDLAPFYEEIGNTVGATNLEVEETAVAITTASGGIAPSVEELALAYDLIAATGTDSATAAAAIGEALRGNMEPLQSLLGDKYNLHELEEVMGDLAGTAAEAKTPIDDVTAAFREWNEELATTEGQKDAAIDVIAAMIPGGTALLDAKNLWDMYWSAMRGEDGEDPDAPEVEKPPLEMSGGGMGGGMIPKAVEQALIQEGVYGVGAAGAGAMATGSQPVSVGITINGDVDSAQRVAVIMRQVEMAQRNMYRGTINTMGIDPRMFPN